MFYVRCTLALPLLLLSVPLLWTGSLVTGAATRLALWALALCPVLEGRVPKRQADLWKNGGED